MAIHWWTEIILLDVILVIYNLIHGNMGGTAMPPPPTKKWGVSPAMTWYEPMRYCRRTGAFSDHEEKTRETIMTKMGHYNISIRVLPLTHSQTFCVYTPLTKLLQNINADDSRLHFHRCVDSGRMLVMPTR